MENLTQSITENLTSPVSEKGRILYTIIFIAAGLFIAVTGVSLYSGAAIILGAVLFYISKIGLDKYWFEEDSKTHWTIGISYLLLVGGGLISWMLISFGVL